MKQYTIGWPEEFGTLVVNYTPMISWGKPARENILFLSAGRNGSAVRNGRYHFGHKRDAPNIPRTGTQTSPDPFKMVAQMFE